MTETAWPPAGQEQRPWRQSVRGGTRADRTLTEVTVTIPPLIGSLTVPMSAARAAAVEAATREIAALDAERGDVLGPLGVLLLRSESVASSKIERVEALGRGAQRVGWKPGADMGAIWRGFTSLGDRESRRAFLATTRAVMSITMARLPIGRPS